MSGIIADLLADNATHAEAFADEFDDLQDGQSPDAVTVCCSDSRVLQDHLWGNDDPGAVFTVGNIGNRVVQRTDAGRVVSGDVLYPVAHTGTDTVVVVGHSGCGAVTAAHRALTEGLDEPAGIEHCVSLLTPLLESGVDRLPADLDDEAAVNHLVEYNVDRQVEFLRSSEAVPDDVTVVGAVYDFQDAYPGRRGEAHVVNVDGDRTPGDHPVVGDRVDRRWHY